MTGARRIALLAAVVVVAVVVFIIAKPSDDNSSSSNTSSSGTPTTVTGPNGQTTTEEPPPHAIANIKVGKDGKPVGGVQELDFGKGQQVEFQVTSAVSDEIHVHGYDLMKDVAPGKPVKFSFKGDNPGRYEVELESRGEQIIDLRVTE
jgi:hypothetical protein